MHYEIEINNPSLTPEWSPEVRPVNLSIVKRFKIKRLFRKFLNKSSEKFILWAKEKVDESTIIKCFHELFSNDQISAHTLIKIIKTLLMSSAQPTLIDAFLWRFHFKKPFHQLNVQMSN